MTTNDPHQPSRGDQIGHGDTADLAHTLSVAGSLDDERLLKLMQPRGTDLLRASAKDEYHAKIRIKAMELAIASMGAPLRDLSAAAFIERAAMFEKYLLEGGPAEVGPEMAAKISGARAYIEDGDGGFKAV